VFDWTDASHPKEIAFFDRGPVDSTRPAGGGSWSAYWYNGVIVSSEIARGLDILELTASGWISQNELDAAKSVRLDYFNTQSQVRLVWPASFALAGAYLDQLERSGGLTSRQLASARKSLAEAQQESGAARTKTLTALAGELEAEAQGAGDPSKVGAEAKTVRALASVKPTP